MTLRNSILLGALVLAWQPVTATAQFQAHAASTLAIPQSPLPGITTAPRGVVPDCRGQAKQAGELICAGAVTMLSPAELAAARIKADEAGIQARRNAIRYLADKDCQYYPEAEFALVAALRSDQSECVRYEAALALAAGCCCTRNVAQSLHRTVSGSDKDGNPRENSERVKTAAWQALNRCQTKGITWDESLAAMPTTPDARPLPKATEQPTKLTGIQLTAYTQAVEVRPTRASEVNGASDATEAERHFAATAGTNPAGAKSRLTPGLRSLLDLFTPSASRPASTPPTMATTAPSLPPLRPIGLTPLGSAPER